MEWGGEVPNQTKIKVPNPPLKVVKVPHKPKLRGYVVMPLRVCLCINKVTPLELSFRGSWVIVSAKRNMLGTPLSEGDQ